jgi:DNA-binding protein H-NS
MAPQGPKDALPLNQHAQPETTPAALDLPPSPRQRAALIHRIRTLMEFWGITAHELRRYKAMPAVQVPTSAKYRHPATGDTWNGRGPQPDWLRHALLKEGFTVEQLRQAASATTESLAQTEDEAPGG